MLYIYRKKLRMPNITKFFMISSLCKTIFRKVINGGNIQKS